MPMLVASNPCGQLKSKAYGTSNACCEGVVAAASIVERSAAGATISPPLQAAPNRSESTGVTRGCERFDMVVLRDGWPGTTWTAYARSRVVNRRSADDQLPRKA